MYLNEAQINLTGYVVTQPIVRSVNSGAEYVSMRVGWTPRRQDRVTGEWVDANTSYATVICWRRLANNAALSLRKGDPVLIKGRLSVRNYEDKSGVTRLAVEVEASTIGHDLSRGVAVFRRTRPQTGPTAAEYAAANGDAGHAGAAAADVGPGGADGAAGNLANDFGRDGEAEGQAPDDLNGSGGSDFSVPDSPADLEDPFLAESGSAGEAARPEPVAVPF
jgi:single-strand DNA-binding protein